MANRSTEKASGLREWRRAHNLTLQEVSDLTGHSVPMLCRVERGQRTFNPLARVRLARLLGVRVRQLFPVE